MKIFVNLYFSDFEPFFCYLGVFAQNVPFIKKNLLKIFVNLYFSDFDPIFFATWGSLLRMSLL